MASIERLHLLASIPECFHFYTDHNNIVFLFDPLALVSDLMQSSLRKFSLFDVHSLVYSYV